VAVFIDELQGLDTGSMAAVSAAAHAAGQRGVPFLIVGAGLPNLPGKLAEAKSYSERLFDYRLLDKLAASTATEALVSPADEIGVSWQAGAVRRVIDAAGGYPYFLQEFGAATWDLAAGPDAITEAEARGGIKIGLVVLDGGFFRSRWDRATPTERLYLAAMAADGGEPSRTPDIAVRMERSPATSVRSGPA